MNIKEIEQKTGMARANIRFYEEKGLLFPKRADNGYRIYSQEDLQTLKRVQLLRSLDFSLEDIRALQTGEKELCAALQEREAAWARQREKAQRAQEICRAMQNEQVTYATLEAEKYISVAPEAFRHAPSVQEDRLPYPFYPWRRFFARMLDQMLINLLWTAVLSIVFKMSLIHAAKVWELVDWGMAILLTMLLEPFFLHLFGTTPGKWIMGLRIEGSDGKKLSLADARSRTWSVLWRGEGLYVPILNFIRNWKSYRACSQGEMSSWDWENSISYIARDRSPFRPWILAAAMVCIFGMNFICYNIAAAPPHRGKVTIGQFAQNYNAALDFYGLSDERRLDAAGKWTEPERDTIAIIFYQEEDFPQLQFSLDQEGYIREISFEYIQEDAELISRGMKNIACWASYALMNAQPSAHIFSFAPWRLVSDLPNSSIGEDFDLSMFGVRASYQCRQSGYMDMGDMMWPANEADNFLSISFSLAYE